MKNAGSVTGRFAEAAASLRQSLSLKPGLAKAEGDLERALIGVGKIAGVHHHEASRNE